MNGSAPSLAPCAATPSPRRAMLKSFGKNFPHFALNAMRRPQGRPQNGGVVVNAASAPAAADRAVRASYAVRRVSAEDVAPLVDLARACYPGYTLDRAREWAFAVLALPNVAAFVSGEAVAMVSWQIEMWRPDERVADLLPFFSKPSSDNPWGAMRVFRAVCDWAKEQGCYAIRFGSARDVKYHLANQIDVFAILAKRIGAAPVGFTYIKEL